MKTIDIHTLKATDPKRFEKAYYKWLEYHDYFDADFIIEDWANTVDSETPININYEDRNYRHSPQRKYNPKPDVSYSIGDRGEYAAFCGRVPVHTFIQHYMPKLAEEYAWFMPEVEAYGGYIDFDTRHESQYTEYSDDMEHLLSYAEPGGLFADMDSSEYSELLCETWRMYFEEEVLEEAGEVAEKLADKLLESLRDEYEYITSEEYFIEHCEANEITFEVEEEEEDV